MKFRPLHDRVLIKVLDSDEKTAGGIIIPDTAKEKPQEGEVVAVGDGTKNSKGNWIPSSLKLGDKIVYNKGTGTKLKLDGEVIVVLKEEEILGLVEWQRKKVKLKFQ